MQMIQTDEVQDIVANSDAVVVNVLKPRDFLRGHIPRSVNVPVDDEDFVERVEALVLDLDELLVVYCAGPDCKASVRAARALAEAGFTEVHSYEDGMQGWIAAGNEVEGGEFNVHR